MDNDQAKQLPLQSKWEKINLESDGRWDECGGEG